MVKVLPGSTIGILGSGQLGRMLAMAAKRMGYKVIVYSPDRCTPAGQVSDEEICAHYDDLDSLRRFASHVDVVTLEFENIPASAIKTIEEFVPVYPQPNILHITQNRLREKMFLKENGFPIVPFARVKTLDALKMALQEIGCPAVLKTAGFGYDGKGQVLIRDFSEVETAYEKMQGAEAVLEKFIDLQLEISVVAARTVDGKFTTFPPGENKHANHILDTTVVPANIPDDLKQRALQITRSVCDELELCGVLCVEFFITRDHQVLINELAPRPHNSGHYTIEACACSQFEQQLRSVCGLPLGNTNLMKPAAMANLLGDLWSEGEPDWEALLAFPDVRLHLYGKAEARPGRKMGHLTALADTPEEALRMVQQARQALNGAIRV